MDSCLVIYLIEGATELRQRVQDLLSEQRDPTICTSGIVRLECLVGALKRADDELAESYRQFLDATISLPVTDEACEHAAELRASNRLLVPDAIHLAVAEAHGCDEFWSADSHFKPVTGLQKVQVRLIA